MTRLPKKYFKSISDYVRTYYTAYGAKRAQKLYECVKTVTKDFTRTDPVHVRIGDDGEPEIHCTMTQADGAYYFANMDLGNATLYVHNGAVLIKCNDMFFKCYCSAIYLDSIGSCTSTDNMFYFTTATKLGLFDTSGVTGSINAMFAYAHFTEIPAFDFSNVTYGNLPFYQYKGILTSIKFTGMRVAFQCGFHVASKSALVEMLTNLGEAAQKNVTTIALGSENKGKLTDEEIKIATDKGWVVA